MNTILQYVIDELQQCTDEQAADKTYIATQFKYIIDDMKIASKELYMLLRYVLTGRHTGPHLADIIAVLGREETIIRIQRYLS